MSQGIVLSPHVEQALQTGAPQVPQSAHLEPFLEAARQVLREELTTTVQVGKLSAISGSCTTSEISVIVGIIGKMTGVAFYGMSGGMGLAVVSHMLGSPVDELDDMALSGISELGNVLAGRAATLLSERGIEVDIAPPVLLVGSGTRVATTGIQRLVVPLITGLGTIEVQLAIKGA